MHQPALHLDTEEPSLVPQWLKDGVLKRNGCSTRHTRTGSQDTVRRVPSLGVSWENNRTGSAGQSSAHENTPEEIANSNGTRLGRVQSLRGASGTKHIPGVGWPSKLRPTDRFNSFERNNNGHERSNSGLSDNWPQSPDIRTSAASDARSDWNHSKDFAARSSLLYSPKHSEETGSEKAEVPFDKEFPSLHSNGAAGSGSVSLGSSFPALGGATVVSSKPGQTWISSVADSTSAQSSVVARSAKNGGFSGQNGLRMAEALANAAANGSAVDNEKAAREQLAVKQSKQLVPVIATNKHKGPTRHIVDSKASSVIDGRKELVSASSRTLERLGSSERPDAKRVNGMLTLKPQSSLKLSTRQLNRTTFFESLKRTSSVGSDSLDNHSPAEHKLSRLAGSLDPSSGSNLLVPVVNENEVDKHMEESLSVAPDFVTIPVEEISNQNLTVGVYSELNSDTTQCNGHVEEEENSARLTPEEEAFLRSLGWTDASDDEDYALTEEEIAAFKARVGGRNLLPVKPKVSLLPLSPHSMFDQYISSSDSDSSSSDSDIY